MGDRLAVQHDLPTRFLLEDLQVFEGAEPHVPNQVKGLACQIGSTEGIDDGSCNVLSQDERQRMPDTSAPANAVRPARPVADTQMLGRATLPHHDTRAENGYG